MRISSRLLDPAGIEPQHLQDAPIVATAVPVDRPLADVFAAVAFHDQTLIDPPIEERVAKLHPRGSPSSRPLDELRLGQRNRQ